MILCALSKKYKVLSWSESLRLSRHWMQVSVSDFFLLSLGELSHVCFGDGGIWGASVVRGWWSAAGFLSPRRLIPGLCPPLPSSKPESLLVSLGRTYACILLKSVAKSNTLTFFLLCTCMCTHVLYGHICTRVLYVCVQHTRTCISYIHSAYAWYMYFICTYNAYTQHVICILYTRIYTHTYMYSWENT